MIIYEDLGNGLTKAYSDRGMMIHGGSPEGDYAETVDPSELNRTYEETDIPIDDFTADDVVEILGEYL